MHSCTHLSYAHGLSMVLMEGVQAIKIREKEAAQVSLEQLVVDQIEYEEEE